MWSKREKVRANCCNVPNQRAQSFYLKCCVFVNGVQEYQSIVDAEWTILYNKLDKISDSGAMVVLSKLPIGDVATQYFADRWVNWRQVSG